MVFSSIPFIYYFLPLVLLFYFIVPKAIKNTVLLISSLIFYGWGEPKYVFLMLLTVSVSYIFGILTDKYRGKIIGKISFILSIVINLSFLIYFKYADFFIENVNRVTGLSIPLLNVILPIGISFYTFQIMSYNIDLYRGKVKVQKNPFTLATYLSLFPQLIAGPIVRYSDVERELYKRTNTIDNIYLGIRRFIFGLSKKVLIANTLGELCTTFTTTNDKSLFFFWLYGISYMLQIYFDFSGYSDMAIGIGKILGFKFPENFNYPFISKSITEFWRRWHISLGSWFRDYVYIPLGGNRVSKRRWFINIGVVWFLTGFWHGAEWNFILWGLYFAILLTIEKLFLIKYLEKSKVLSHIYLLFTILVSFVLFSGNSLSDSLYYIGGLFGKGINGLISFESIYYLKSYGLIIFTGIICSTPLPLIIKRYSDNIKPVKIIFDYLEIPFLILLLTVITGFLADGSFNPFLYFRF